MRLIDAEALKAALKSNCKPELCHDYNTDWCEICCRTNDFENLIDNAPTVNSYFPISEEVFYKITDAEWEHSNSFWVTTPSGKKVEFEKKRPQGEWLDNDREDTYRRCSICNELVEKDNYCGNCGADMRKGEEK